MNEAGLRRWVRRMMNRVNDGAQASVAAMRMMDESKVRMSVK